MNVKTLIQIMICATIVACGRDDNGLELTIFNTELVCVKDITPETINETGGLIYDDKYYDSISRNVIHYKLTNNSNKKYFIVLDENKIGTTETDTVFEKHFGKRIQQPAGLIFNLLMNNQPVFGKTTLTTGGGDYKTELEYYKSKMYVENYVDSVFLKNVDQRQLFKPRRLTTIYKNYLEKSFVLHPGETRYFTSVVNLPLRKDGHWISLPQPNDKTFAALTFANFAKYTKPYLSNDQQKSIEENDYVLFDGKVNSNKVPVRFINFNK